MLSQSKIQVLLIEDDKDDADLVKDLLNSQKINHYEVKWLKSYDEALQMISAGELIYYDIVLIDHYLGKETSFSLIHKITDKKLSIPIILLTGTADIAVDLEAMKLGVSDYLVKNNLDGDLLDRSIRYSIEHKKNQKLLIQQQQKTSAMTTAGTMAELTAFVNHEINNPLAVIQGNVSALQTSLSKGEMDKEKLTLQANKISNMVKRIIEIKKNLHFNYAQMMMAKRDPVDIIALINEAIEL